eukprot:CAMPEP_0203831892 /NCGR_PEP_ID=MMETSP0115-20131106/69417_1 /ASSEMBLY_ACC=CAM_ASM_000227 /TAXON_ID=33651 /ORGANISM="Bicosoecid sp, Strain ms1" /LENGTH=199 /DNA_ID=CAMNT_0050740949 /DNA_START=342 /DNA_END=937 /DNA_ORIENTATION=-
MSATFFDDMLADNRRLREQNAALKAEVERLKEQLDGEVVHNRMLAGRTEEARLAVEADARRMQEVERLYQALQKEHRRLQDRVEALKSGGVSTDIHLQRAAGTINRYKNMYEGELKAKKKLARQLAKAQGELDRLQQEKNAAKNKTLKVKDSHADPFFRTDAVFLPSPERPDPGSPSAPRSLASLDGAAATTAVGAAAR